MDGAADPKLGPARNKRRRVVAAAVAVIAAGLCLWWAARRPLSDGERALVGTWRARMNAAGADPVAYEFRPDRTCVPPGGTPAGATWRREGDTLIIRYPDGGYSPWWDVLGRRRPWREVLTLATDGPGRFRYTGVLEVGGRPPAQPPVTGALVRVDPSAGSPEGAGSRAEPGAAADPPRAAGR